MIQSWRLLIITAPNPLYPSPHPNDSFAFRLGPLLAQSSDERSATGTFWPCAWAASISARRSRDGTVLPNAWSTSFVRALNHMFSFLYICLLPALSMHPHHPVSRLIVLVGSCLSLLACSSPRPNNSSICCHSNSHNP